MKKFSIMSIVLLAALFTFWSPAFAEDTVTTTCTGPNCTPTPQLPEIDCPDCWQNITTDPAFNTLTAGIDLDIKDSQALQWNVNLPCDSSSGSANQNFKIEGITLGGAGYANGGMAQSFAKEQTYVNGVQGIMGAQSALYGGGVSPTGTWVNFGGDQSVTGGSDTSLTISPNSFSMLGYNGMNGNACVSGNGVNINYNLNQIGKSYYDYTVGDPASGKNYAEQMGFSQVTTQLTGGSAPMPQD